MPPSNASLQRLPSTPPLNASPQRLPSTPPFNPSLQRLPPTPPFDSSMQVLRQIAFVSTQKAEFALSTVAMFSASSGSSADASAADTTSSGASSTDAPTIRVCPVVARFVSELEALVQQDPGNRGIEKILVKGELLKSALSLASAKVINELERFWSKENCSDWLSLASAKVINELERFWSKENHPNHPDWLCLSHRPR